MAFDDWESYLYPGTHVLRNRWQEQDPDVLSVREHAATRRRARELHATPSLIEHTWDAAHLRALHGYLFQDAYEWAGQYRTVDMSKGDTDFGTVRPGPGAIDRYVDQAHRIIEETRWDELSREEFGEAAAQVYAWINQAHPFREGNGRTGRELMTQLAARSPFDLHWSRISKAVWNQYSALTAPDRGKWDPQPEMIVAVFTHLAVRRPQMVQPEPPQPAPAPRASVVAARQPGQLDHQRPVEPEPARQHVEDPPSARAVGRPAPEQNEAEREAADRRAWDHQQAEVAEDREKDAEADRQHHEIIEDQGKDVEAEQHTAEVSEDRDKDAEVGRSPAEAAPQPDRDRDVAATAATAITGTTAEGPQQTAASGRLPADQVIAGTYAGPRDSRQAALVAQGRDLDQLRRQDHIDPAAREEPGPVYRRPQDNRTRGVEADRPRQSGRDYGARGRSGGPEQDLRRDEVRNPRGRREPARPYRSSPERGGRDL